MYVLLLVSVFCVFDLSFADSHSSNETDHRISDKFYPHSPTAVS